MTSKSDKSMHGIGLKSVEAVVNKYDGMKHMDYDEKEFFISIILYFPAR